LPVASIMYKSICVVGLAGALDDDVAERAVLGRAAGGEERVHQRRVGAEQLEAGRADETVDAHADTVAGGRGKFRGGSFVCPALATAGLDGLEEILVFKLRDFHGTDFRDGNVAFAIDDQHRFGEDKAIERFDADFVAGAA